MTLDMYKTKRKSKAISLFKLKLLYDKVVIQVDFPFIVITGFCGHIVLDFVENIHRNQIHGHCDINTFRNKQLVKAKH